MKRIVFIIAITLIITGLEAQTYNMPSGSNTASYTTCNGTFYDAGGLTGAHGLNQSSTVTFTPGTAGMAIRLVFSMFTVGEGATLLVYDGPTTTSTLIATYTQYISPIGLDIVASSANTTGQITVSFTSGSSNEMGWVAAISCRAPCQSYSLSLDPVATTKPLVDNLYINVCKGECVSFGAMSNYTQNNVLYAQSDNTTNFYWKFGNTILDTGQLVTHCFNEVRGYDFTLFAVDVQGCYPTSLFKGRIRVSDNPISAIPELPDVCSGIELAVSVGSDPTSTIIVSHSGSRISGTLSHADTTFLPDGSNISYTSSLLYDVFEPGQILSNINQLIGILINMEHSYLGDLSLKITCPNGQTCQLKSYGTMPAPAGIATAGSTGGGNIHLGFAPDPATGNNCYLVPGIGFDYIFIPTGTNAFGTNGPTTSVTYTDPCGTQQTWQQLNAGYYGSYENMNALIGCPLNGNWVITVTDHLSLDNGYIFRWEMSLDESIIPGGWDYSVGLDTVIWSGNNISSTSDTTAIITTTDAGNFVYNFSIIDEYGCQFDSSFTLNIVAGPTPNLGEDVGICEGELFYLESNFYHPSAHYIWNTGATSQNIYVLSQGKYTVTVTSYNEDSTLICSAFDTVLIYIDPQPDCDFRASVTESCAPMELIFTNLTTPEDIALTYDWRVYNLEGVLVFSSTLKNPELTLTEPGDYHVQLLVESEHGCRDSIMKWNYLSVYAQPLAEFSATPEISLLGESGGVITFTNYADPAIISTPGIYWYWDFGDGVVDSSEFEPVHTYETWGDYNVTLFIETEHGCSDEIIHTVIIEADLVFPNVITPNGDGINDVFAIINLNTKINSEDPDKYRTNSLHIYDRWGKRVYQTDNYDTFMKGDELQIGSNYFSGEGLPDGVYYFTFYYKGKAKVVNYHGIVNIIR